MRASFVVASVVAVGCVGSTSGPPPATGGPCTYEPFETTCDFVESGGLPTGKLWAKYRARGVGARGRVEVDVGAADRAAVESALHRPIRCRGDRATSGSCAPFSLTLDAPPIPSGATVTYTGLD